MFPIYTLPCGSTFFSTAYSSVSSVSEWWLHHPSSWGSLSLALLPNLILPMYWPVVSPLKQWEQNIFTVYKSNVPYHNTTASPSHLSYTQLSQHPSYCSLPPRHAKTNHNPACLYICISIQNLHLTQWGSLPMITLGSQLNLLFREHSSATLNKGLAKHESHCLLFVCSVVLSFSHFPLCPLPHYLEL